MIKLINETYYDIANDPYRDAFLDGASRLREELLLALNKQRLECDNHMVGIFAGQHPVYENDPDDDAILSSKEFISHKFCPHCGTQIGTEPS